MKLKIRYENEYQTLELDEAATEELWISLSIEGKDLSQCEKEKRIQEEFEKEFNRPEYNSWHKFDRHRGYSKVRAGNEEIEEGIDFSEHLIEEVADDRIFRKDEIEREERESYDDVCRWVRKVLLKKPKWADAFITIRMEGVSVNDYAASIGVKDASIISKWLARAEKKLRQNYPH